MDLALELGMTVGELTHRMSYDELSEWAHYSAKRALPTRRLEIYLSQAAAAFAGGAIKDFLVLDKKDEADPIDVVTMFTGANVIRVEG